MSTEDTSSNTIPYPYAKTSYIPKSTLAYQAPIAYMLACFTIRIGLQEANNRCSQNIL